MVARAFCPNLDNDTVLRIVSSVRAYYKVSDKIKFRDKRLCLSL